jgi:hypothetical protein
MLGWIKRKVQIASLKSQNEDIDRFIAGVRGADALQVGMIVAVATTHRNVLLSKGINLLDPIEAMERHPFFLLQLGGFIRDVQKRNRPEEAPGWMVWLHTIRAAITPELRFKGRILWKELARGFPCVEDAAHDLFVLGGLTLNVEGYGAIPEGLEDDGRQS